MVRGGIAPPLEPHSINRPRGAARAVAKAIMEHETSILSASRLAVGCAWIQLLDCANGAEEPPAAGCSSKPAPVHDPMEFPHVGMIATCGNSIRSCAEAILELGPSNAITHFLCHGQAPTHPSVCGHCTHKRVPETRSHSPPMTTANVSAPL